MSETAESDTQDVDVKEADKAGGGGKGTKRAIVMLVVALVFVAGGGAGAYWWLHDADADAEVGASSDSKDYDDYDDYDDAVGDDEPDGGDANGGEGDDGEPAGAPARRRIRRSAENAKGVIEFSPFVVNLVGRETSGFVRVMVQLAVADEETPTLVDKQPVLRARLRAAMIELLAQQTADVLTTPEGKTALKDAIVDRARGIMKPHGRVLDVLFTEFLVQY